MKNLSHHHAMIQSQPENLMSPGQVLTCRNCTFSTSTHRLESNVCGLDASNLDITWTNTSAHSQSRNSVHMIDVIFSHSQRRWVFKLHLSVVWSEWAQSVTENGFSRMKNDHTNAPNMNCDTLCWKRTWSRRHAWLQRNLVAMVTQVVGFDWQMNYEPN